MIDVFDLPNNVNKQIFNAANSSGSWQTWNKPKGATVAYIMCIGSGGGGGGMRNWTSPNPGAAGGGGGGAAYTIATVPFFLIPDVLYIQVAVGGIGGGSPNVEYAQPGGGEDGGNGALSYVSLYPSTNMSDCLVVNGASIAGGGQGGRDNTLSGNGGGGGAALSANSTTNPRYLSLCTWYSNSGQGGSAGGAYFNGGGGFRNAVNLTLLANGITGGGTGGGGFGSGAGSSNGGIIQSADLLYSQFVTLDGAGPTVSRNNQLAYGEGTTGYQSAKPFFFTGGAGGLLNQNTFQRLTAIGGIGATGSGGGGAGMSGSQYIGAAVDIRTGRGGGGLVIITSY